MKASRFLQLFAFLGAWLILLFGAAGRLDWIRGWIYVATYIVGMGTAGVVAWRANPAVYEARANWRRKDTKRFDKLILAAFVPFSLLQPGVAGLDAVRFGWSSMPFWTVYPGIVLFGAASAIIAWVLAINRFAESTVRIQTDRGHTVVNTGPYRMVRHPMYVGAILLYVATPLLLGSVWAFAVSGAIVALFICRTALEDRTLRRELPGYEEFAARTRYRLVPGVW